MQPLIYCRGADPQFGVVLLGAPCLCALLFGVSAELMRASFTLRKFDALAIPISNKKLPHKNSTGFDKNCLVALVI